MAFGKNRFFFFIQTVRYQGLNYCDEQRCTEKLIQLFFVYNSFMVVSHSHRQKKTEFNTMQ